jgi:hypothetical protein
MIYHRLQDYVHSSNLDTEAKPRSSAAFVYCSVQQALGSSSSQRAPRKVQFTRRVRGRYVSSSNTVFPVYLSQTLLPLGTARMSTPPVVSNDCACYCCSRHCGKGTPWILALRVDTGGSGAVCARDRPWSAFDLGRSCDCKIYFPLRHSNLQLLYRYRKKNSKR